MGSRLMTRFWQEKNTRRCEYGMGMEEGVIYLAAMIVENKKNEHARPIVSLKGLIKRQHVVLLKHVLYVFL